MKVIKYEILLGNHKRKGHGTVPVLLPGPSGPGDKTKNVPQPRHGDHLSGLRGDPGGAHLQ